MLVSAVTVLVVVLLLRPLLVLLPRSYAHMPSCIQMHTRVVVVWVQ